MKEEVLSWIDDQREMGMTVEYDDMKVGGFPLSIRARIKNFTWADPGEWSWSGEELFVIALPYDWTRIILMPRGPQTVTVDGQTYDVTADDIRVSLGNTKYGAETNDLVAVHPDRTVKIGSLKANYEISEDEEAWRAGARVRDIVFTDESDRDAEMPFVNLSTSGLFEDPNVVNLEGVEFSLADDDSSTPTILSANGQVGIDGFNKPEGQINLVVKHPNALFDMLKRFDVADPVDLEKYRNALNIATNNGESDTALPIFMRDGQLYLGPAPIADLPTIR